MTTDPLAMIQALTKSVGVSPNALVTHCRMCASDELLPAFALPPTPLANAYLDKERPAHAPPARYPLTVMVCQRCLHSQLREFVLGSTLFTNYLYTTGTSPSFRKHFEVYAKWLVNEVRGRLDKAPVDTAVLEVGANDGTFLRELHACGFAALGLEPAANLVSTYGSRTSPMMPVPFDLHFAREWVLQGNPPFDVVVGNNVFAHVESLVEVMQALALVTRPGALFVAEVQYLAKLFETGAFDMVYHEHRDYHLLSEWQEFLHRFGWQLLHAEAVPTHGGSVRLLAQRRPVLGVPSESLADLLQAEGLINPMAEWQRLQKNVATTREALHAVLTPFQRVAIYGAPAKLTTLAAALELERPSCFAYVVDDAPMKQGKVTPNGLWPIVARTLLRSESFDAILIGAWNVRDDIIEQVRGAGIKLPLIVPFPKVEVIK